MRSLQLNLQIETLITENGNESFHSGNKRREVENKERNQGREAEIKDFLGREEEEGKRKFGL